MQTKLMKSFGGCVSGRGRSGCQRLMCGGGEVVVAMEVKSLVVLLRVMVDGALRVV
ncbi:hypothetical protein TSUD_23920 [Trifolium subterraneum]|uniref:Uncharacterized protein n=1 Tax=Trifolium subterraneum TaxID=3900 RepID=A0A2Z6LYK8_TRISU|nr:hypothetical protein TSUD_23920 [Trifolium subterraneum]